MSLNVMDIVFDKLSEVLYWINPKPQLESSMVNKPAFRPIIFW